MTHILNQEEDTPAGDPVDPTPADPTPADPPQDPTPAE